MPKNHTGASLLSINELRPHPDNPNDHTADQIEQLSEIIDYQGWRVPIIKSNQSGYIASGHARWMVAQRMQWSEVPVVCQDFESEEQEYLFVVSDNAIATQSEINMAMVNLKVTEIGPFPVKLLGFKNYVVDMSEKEAIFTIGDGGGTNLAWNIA